MIRQVRLYGRRVTRVVGREGAAERLQSDMERPVKSSTSWPRQPPVLVLHAEQS